MTIPPWVAISSISVIFLLVVSLIIWLYLPRRWIRVRGIISLATGFCIVPAVTVVMKGYGVNISINETSWPSAIVTGIAMFFLYHLELQTQKSEASEMLLHQFRVIMERKDMAGFAVPTVSRELGAPESRIEAILLCIDTISKQLRHEFEVVLQRHIKSGISMAEVARELGVPTSRIRDVVLYITEVERWVHYGGGGNLPTPPP